MTGPARITKTLTPNDVGQTGGHQAGILIPKAPEILSFFPKLGNREKNPRCNLTFWDDDGLTRWNFSFIYYNNRFYGGTRNEYRLTCMTRYLRSKNAKVGDELVLIHNAEGRLLVKCTRSSRISEHDGVLRLSGGWKVISLK